MTGVFSLLDEESKLPRPTPDHFTAEVHARNKSHYRLCVSLFIVIFANCPVSGGTVPLNHTNVPLFCSNAETKMP